MNGLENIQNNTAGEAGQNTEFKNFIDSIIEEKVGKAYSAAYNIGKANQNKFGLSDDEFEVAINNYKEDKQKQANAEKEKYSKVMKDLEAANARIAQFEAKEKVNFIKENSMNVFKQLSITDTKKINLIHDLLGDKLHACVKDDGSFDDKTAKTLFEDIVTKYGIEKDAKEDVPGIRFGGTKEEDKVITKKDLRKMSASQRAKMIYENK